MAATTTSLFLRICYTVVSTYFPSPLFARQAVNRGYNADRFNVSFRLKLNFYFCFIFVSFQFYFSLIPI